MVNYRAATFRPFEDKWSVLIGSVVGGLPIVNILLAGFVLRATRPVVPNGVPRLPLWNQWATLFLDGLRVWCVGLALAAPALLFMLAAGAAHTLDSLLTPILALCAVFLALVSAYLFPGAIVLLARTGRIRTALQWKRLLAATLTREYALTWLVSVVAYGALFYALALLALATLWTVLLPILFAGFAAYVAEIGFMSAVAQAIPTEFNTLPR